MQLRIAAEYLFITLLSAFLAGVMVYVTVWPVMRSYVPFALLHQIQAQIVTRLIAYSGVLIVFITISCIVLTHRIAGPLYNMERKLEKLLEGESAELIHLRNGDEMKTLADKLNALILKVRDKLP